MSEDITCAEVLAEPIHEIGFNGELGNLLGYHIDGHVDFSRTDEIMAIIDEEHGGTGYDCDWNISHNWVSKEAVWDDEGETIDGAWSFVYSDTEVPDSRAVTLLQHENTWRYRCVNHPEDVASTGHHRSSIIDEDVITPAVPDAWEQVCTKDYVYMCLGCSTDFRARMKAVRSALVGGAA